MNDISWKLLTSAMSQRRIAKILNLHRITVVRKLLFLAEQFEPKLCAHNEAKEPAMQVEFDDLETIEHSKLKPLSVIMMVESKTRRILGFEVAQMPAKGKLAEIARQKYGKRADHRPKARRALFERVSSLIAPDALIKCDESPHYPRDVVRFFPQAKIKTFKGRRARPHGQGELKVGYDPIFSINHTFAMMRANINRLIKRTWCTTKRPDRLRAHVILYAHYHNTVLI